MVRFRLSVGMMVGIAACNSGVDYESIQSSIEAGAPTTPIYTRIRLDDVTGDKTPVVVNGTNANCTTAAPCFIADPDADSYFNDEFERPSGQGAAAVNYLPAIDIVSGQTGIDPDWLFYRINLYGVQAGQTPGSPGSLPHFYGIEVNFDNDPQGDVIFEINQPSLNVGTNWGTTGLQARVDRNETMGGPRPLLADGPGQAGGGYEHKVFDGGQNTAQGKPGGSTAMQARIVGNAVEIAVYRPFLDALTNAQITSFAFRPYAAVTQVSTSELYTHDDKNRAQMGSPYPWLRLTGAPAGCPAGSAGDNGTTAAEVAALESGTNVDTGIANPCYAVGGVYQRDNAGTVSELAGKDDLSVKVDLLLDKSDAPDLATIGDTIVYTLAVTNTQPLTVSNAVVTDVLPATVTFQSASSNCTYVAATTTVTCTFPLIAPNATVTAQVTVRPDAIGDITNTATVTSDGEEKTPNNNTDSTTTTVEAACGNGIVNTNEGCDDGNTMNGDGCEGNCKLPLGGTCDEDSDCDSNTCDTLGSDTCEQPNVCGNSHVEGAEACDDGNTVGGDTCEANCKLPIGAPCDEDSDCNSNTCDTQGSDTCEQPNTCGNGHIEGAEICDDGNTSPGDTCNPDCKLPNGSTCNNDNQCSSNTCDPTSNTCEPSNTCGNGHLDTGEVCDDGNTAPGDTCDIDCKLPNGSTCTMDNQCHSGVCDLTSGKCEPADVCGNGKLETGETCDDGNTASGDTCESTCKLPNGSTCTIDTQCHSGVCDPTSGKCEPKDVCGNGKTETGETCDDGGTTSGDGCSATCQSEIDTDKDGVFDLIDIDDDNDGMLDTAEGTVDTDSDAAPDARDLDSDNDGICDATESGHAFPDLSGDYLADCPQNAYGVNGFCNELETATDSGTAKAASALDFDKDGALDYKDLDTDNDSIADLHEGGSLCADANDDGVCDGSDADKDGIAVSIDLKSGFGTMGARAPTQTDGDNVPDYKDLDSDDDRVFDIIESKRAVLDGNKDGVIDATEDSDNDGVRNVADDSDLDQVPDSDEPETARFAGLHDVRIWSDDDDKADYQDADADNDTLVDDADNCRVTHNPDQDDMDDDGTGDVCDPNDGRSWGVQGAACGCASSQSSPSSLLFILGAIGVVIGRRRRRAAKLVAAALVVTPVAANAQVVQGDFSTERFQLATDREGILDVESGSVREHLSLDMGLWLGYANDPLILNRTDNGTTHVGSLVANQVAGELVGALGLFNRLQIGLAVPLVLSQSDSIPTGGTTPTAPSSSFAVGDLRFIPKVSLIKQSDVGVDLSFWLALTAPTASGDGFSGDTNWTVAPALALSRKSENGLRTAFNLGYRTRERRMSLDLEVNDEVFAGLGVAKQFGDVEINGGFGFATAANDMFGAFNRNYAELKLGGSYDFKGPLLAFVATGAGLAEGYGTPDWRMLAGVRVDREKPEVAPPIPDSDRDGLLDNIDKCPTEPEDMDQFEDSDGCPDRDDDKDGIQDVEDKCRMEPEDVDQFEDTDGCPETDNDKDGVLDAADKCPVDPEDMDSFQDDDGCPENDNDQDTVLDAQDKCPNEAGAVDNNGCPWPDSDGDGIIDKFDNCPKWKGTAEHQGCNIKQLVKITETKLELYETTFFATNKAVIQKRSYKLLNNVAEVIKNHPDLKITIEGHTDSVGSDKRNLKLSQMRAQSVMGYLVKRGVDAARLAAQGFGEERPIAENKTSKGRSQNRRVEFMASRVIETTTTTTVPAPDPTVAPAMPAQPKK